MSAPIFRAEDGSLWRWNAFRSDLQRVAAISPDKQPGTEGVARSETKLNPSAGEG